MSDTRRKAATDPAEQAVRALTTRTPWSYVGISRSSFYRLLSKGEAPAPVQLAGVWPHWRVADLDRWIGSLKQSRRRYHNRRPTRKAPQPGGTMQSA
jgi:predicted DNA-binding transcriptional regulator AlpA